VSVAFDVVTVIDTGVTSNPLVIDIFPVAALVCVFAE